MGSNEIDICRSKLYVWGDDLDPGDVTELLQTPPDEKGKRGERSRRMGPPGHREPTSFVLTRGFWKKAIDSHLGEELDLPEQLKHWCDKLESRREAVNTLRAGGNQLIIDCYVSTGPVFLLRLPPDLLLRIGALGVELKLGIYDGTSKEWTE